VIYSDVIIAASPKFVNKNFTNLTWKQLENSIIAILSNLNPHSVAYVQNWPARVSDIMLVPLIWGHPVNTSNEDECP